MERLGWPHTRARVAIQKQFNIVDQSLLLPVDCCKKSTALCSIGIGAVMYAGRSCGEHFWVNTTASTMAIWQQYTVLSKVE
jgi:hypothetical protein